ncbi:MAG: DNA primase [Verrucomicrobiota bacterium]|nr:DNA primase [Verrucomicrobiota bacterium]
MIPQNVIDEINNHGDILHIIEEYVNLKKTGSNFKGLCPFHHEKTPSFSVNPEKGFYYCFGCHAKGNIISFIMQIENMEFPDAVRLVAEKLGIHFTEEQNHTHSKQKITTSSRHSILSLLEKTRDWYMQNLKKSTGKIAADYLKKRNLPEEFIEKFQIGASPDSWDATKLWATGQGFSHDDMKDSGQVAISEDAKNKSGYDRFRGRLMFPIHDTQGKCIGFSARTLKEGEKKAKYVNTPETVVFKKNKVLYGFYLAKKIIRETDTVILCEGQLDVIACHMAGITNAVAPQGTAFTSEQARLLARFAKYIIVCFDSDSAGIKATEKVFEELLKVNLTMKVVRLPDNEDPFSIYDKYGAEKLMELVNNAQDFFDNQINVVKNSAQQISIEERTQDIDSILQKTALIKSPVLRALQIQKISENLNIPEETLFAQLKNFISQSSRRQRHPVAPGRHQREILSPIQQAELTLIDLCIKHGSIAHKLEKTLPPEYIGNEIYGTLLNEILALTAQGEWEHAANNLINHHPQELPQKVYQILMNSEYEELAAETHEHQERLKKAQDDCIKLLKKTYLESQLNEINHKISKEQDTKIKQDLSLKYFNISQQINEMNRK